MDMLQKLMQEKMKKGKDSSDVEMDPRKKTAMLGILDHISRMAEGAMGDDMNKELSQKVSVSASDSKGLKSGLDEAKKLVDKKGMPLHSDDFDETPSSEKEEDHEAMVDGVEGDPHKEREYENDDEDEDSESGE